MDSLFRAWLNKILPAPPAVSALSYKALQQAAAAKDLADLENHPERAMQLARSANGYVREGVLRYIGQTLGREALSIAIDGLNDWVPQVRSQAAVLYRLHLQAERGNDLVACLPKILRLQVKSRHNHQTLLSETRDLLAAEKYRPAVLAQLRNESGYTARLLLDWLLNDQTPSEVLFAALACADPSVRARAMQAVGQFPLPTQWELLQHARHDRAAGVRVRVLEFGVAAIADEGEKLAYCRSFLLDRNATVRTFARWHAKQLGMNVADFYHSELVNADRPAGELIALCWETASPANLGAMALAESLINHPCQEVRHAAWQLLLIKSPDAREALFEQAVGDRSLKLKRQLFKLSDKSNFAFCGDWLYRNAYTAYQRSDLVTAVWIASRLSRWRCLQLALELLSVPGSGEHASKLLEQLNAAPSPYWAYSRPSEQEREALATLLSRQETIQVLGGYPNLVADLREKGLWGELRSWETAR